MSNTVKYGLNYIYIYISGEQSFCVQGVLSPILLIYRIPVILQLFYLRIYNITCKPVIA